MDRFTLAELLEWRARQDPDRTFLRMRSMELTYGEFNERANELAHGLARLGVRQGEVVSVMLPNCPQFVLAWFAIAKLGAVEAAINTAFRGPGLTHMLNVCASKVLITDESLMPAFELVHDSLTHLETVIVTGDTEPAKAMFRDAMIVPFDEVPMQRDSDPRGSRDDTELAMLLFTSGTTGRSKACMLSHRFILQTAERGSNNWNLSADDVLYCPFPLFHTDAAVLTIVTALLCGCVAAIGERFSLSGFWSEVRAFDATVFEFMGSTLTLLQRQPPSPSDRDHRVRIAWGVPLPDWYPEFEDRFGIKIVGGGYGSTEAGIVAFRSPTGGVPSGSCGKPTAPYEVRIVDERDREVPTGVVGEMVIRSAEPWTLFSGYYGMAAETVDVWRNLWFHTGDRASKDVDGFLYFAGRKKDAIRRRGENVSAREVEEVLASHPAVQDVAVIGVPSDLSEEDIKACLVLRPGAGLTPEGLLAWCEQRMSRFMVPRYLEFVDGLPMTPTEKVEKHVLIENWRTPTTWDRERADLSERKGSSG